MKVQYINNTVYSFRVAKEGDVGHDLHVDIFGCKRSFIDRFISRRLGKTVMVIWPFQAKLAASGIRLSQTHKTWCMVTARSSAMKKKLMVIGGIIDSGYQGELFAVLHNFGLRPRVIQNGERYAQVIFFHAMRPQLEERGWFDTTTERGDTGFGSSGQ